MGAPLVGTAPDGPGRPEAKGDWRRFVCWFNGGRNAVLARAGRRWRSRHGPGRMASGEQG